MNIREILETIRDDKSLSTTERGNEFEKITKIFLQNDAIQKNQFSKVWTWTAWQKLHADLDFPTTDSGVDLVAELRNAPGEFCAVQCKFIAPDSSVTKDAMNSFLSLSANKTFSRRILATTSDQEIQKKSNPTIDEKPFNIIRTTDLEQSDIDWNSWQKRSVTRKPPKILRPHQDEALKLALKHFQKPTGDDRARITMACGTGKTLLSLRIAEAFAKKEKNKPYLVLYMVPSLALMSQVVREWKNDCIQDFAALSVCSDPGTGRRRSSDDSIYNDLKDLAFAATTDADSLVQQFRSVRNDRKIITVFCTYHSTGVLTEAQKKHLPDFDLVFCDEAHRTTGARFLGKDEKEFSKIHSERNVGAKRRIYMTATPKIYSSDPRKKTDLAESNISSMDDPTIYGPEIYSLTFDEAVKKDLLSDYKVIMLSVDEEEIEPVLREMLARLRENESGANDILELDELSKFIGSWKALKQDGIDSENPIKTALAFSSTIKKSERFARNFHESVEIYDEQFGDGSIDTTLEAEHVDGSHNAATRNERLYWLQKQAEDHETCKVLSNVRCLSEGVDVPALDAILFLDPKQSQIDVIQSVGRVMRKAEGKEIGYVILPIVVNSKFHTEKKITNTGRYKVIWQILNALRSHDRNMDQYINKMDLGEDVSDKLVWVDTSTKKEKTRQQDQDDGIQYLNLYQIPPPLKAEIIRKCGTRDYWQSWAQDIAKIAETHITRLNGILKEPDTPERKAFTAFLEEIRDDLNPEISEQQAIEMLAQHTITAPVFDALFSGEHSFTSQNSISIAMEKTLSLVDKHHLDAESRSLQKFYEDVRFKASGIETLQAKQNLIKQLYGDFFKGAFPKTVEKFGIFYTPVEIVDFMIHSVQHVLEKEFDSSLSDKMVDILDPFTGTGTFITRLIQSGLLGKNLEQKYMTGLHANEIMLLAYYIACVNIEAVFHATANKKPEEYTPFPGSILTDTLHLAEQDRDMVANLMKDNSGRRKRQKKKPIKIIIGNPPYSIGQKSLRDHAANTDYPNLNRRIKETYSGKSTSSKKSMYDSYMQAFRYATDRLENKNNNEGIIAFITNGSWITNPTADGFRRSLGIEFDRIYIFNLRGDFRVQGERNNLEGENIFNIKSPIAITILVKKIHKNFKREGKVFYYQFQNYMKNNQKMSFLIKKQSIENIDIEEIIPDENHTWLSQGKKEFQTFISIDSNKEDKIKSIFKFSSSGIASNRGDWVVNFSKNNLISNVTNSMDFYNQEMRRINAKTIQEVNMSVSRDPKKIKYNDGDIRNIIRKRSKELDMNKVEIQLFKAFTKKWSYTGKNFNHRVYQTNSIFPNEINGNINENNTLSNVAITIGSPSPRKEFSCFICKEVPNLHLLQNAKNFPLHKYNLNEKKNQKPQTNPEMSESNSAVLFQLNTLENSEEEPLKEYAISEFAMKTWRDAYPSQEISEEDLFYYVYGILHSYDYREQFCNDLYSSFPRIPILAKYKDFKAFSDAGRRLAEIHLNYETIEPYPATLNETRPAVMTDRDHYRVRKMAFVKTADKKNDLTKVRYNTRITIEDIPEKAWDYRLDGYPALKWIMNQQQVKTDKDSGITNDPNDWANETMNNPRYPLDLFLQVITVSMKTLKIMENLPKLEIRASNPETSKS